MAEAGDSIGASEPISCTAAASRPSLESKLQTAENTNKKYYLTAYFAASTATLITDVPAALEAALTAAWHAVGLTVGPAVQWLQSNAHTHAADPPMLMLPLNQ